MSAPTTGFAEINGANLYYEVAGAGQPLVLLHAGICDSRMWDDQFAAFAGRHRVVRYDLRGFGRSKMVAGPYAHRRDLRELLRFLDIERACLVGCSFAAAMAIFLFSLTGVPPLLGFYAKYYIIQAAIESGYTWLAIVVVVLSAVSAYFYLRQWYTAL